MAKSARPPRGLLDTSVVIDLEDIAPATARGPAVAAWVAMGLYDLIDLDNEAHDTVDGTASLDNPFMVVDALTTHLTRALNRALGV